MNQPLQEFVQTASPQAFGSIVRLHTDAVYSQCLRQLKDPALAEEVTQRVFITLSRKAPKISRNAVLAGWLFNTTRNHCADIRRAQIRRRKYEQQAMEFRAQIRPDPSDDLQTEAEPLLNNALADLRSKDRDAILLRYFHGQSLRKVGAAMGVSEDAAKQRISRAVEKLRIWFAGKGLAVPSATLAVWLSNAVKPAPAHLVSTMAALHLPKSAGVIWSWLASKVAASVVLGTISIAAAAVSIKEIAATKPPPPDAPLVMADNNTPATQPVTVGSQATPIDALKKLSTAIHQNDHAAIDACLTDDGTDPQVAALVRALFFQNAAWCHVQRASSTAFKTTDVPFKTLSFTMFPYLGGGYEAMIDRMLAQPVPPEIKVDGETASVKVNLPPALFGGSGTDRARELERWSGAMLILKKVNGDWKLDTTRTINIIVHNDLLDRKADPMKVDLQLTNMLSDALEDGAGQIESGQLGSPAAAGDVMERSLIDAFRACHVNFMGFTDLPVVGG
jgi:RNA polymerase sigma factor (sigma-70 family)